MMTNADVFDKAEYEKLISALGLSENVGYSNEKSDEQDYFNAWNFGQTEDDFQYIISTSSEC